MDSTPKIKITTNKVLNPNTPVPSTRYSAISCDDQYIYMCGICIWSSSDLVLYKFDLNSRKWQQLTKSLVKFSTIPFYLKIYLCNDYLYVCGFSSGRRGYDSIGVFDLKNEMNGAYKFDQHIPKTYQACLINGNLIWIGKKIFELRMQMNLMMDNLRKHHFMDAHFAFQDKT